MSDVKNNSAKNRYELEVDGHIAFADYRLDGKVLTIPHVEAPPVLRGTGTAGNLMQGVMEIARAEGFKVVPVCGYAASWIRRHAEYRDLLQ